MNGVKSNYVIPVLQVDNETAVGADRADVLAKAFVKIHSSENLSPKAKICREKTIEQNLGIRNRRRGYRCRLVFMS